MRIDQLILSSWRRDSDSRMIYSRLLRFAVVVQESKDSQETNYTKRNTDRDCRRRALTLMRYALSRIFVPAIMVLALASSAVFVVAFAVSHAGTVENALVGNAVPNVSVGAGACCCIVY